MRRAIVAALVVTLSALALPAEDSASLLHYLSLRREVSYESIPRKVLAFYYPWYATPEGSGAWRHWEQVNLQQRDIASSTHYPAGGPYDSHDPAAIDRHISEAQAAGIDGFISSWWGQGDFTDEAMPAILTRAGQSGFDVSVYWEDAPGQGQAQIDRAVADLAYVMERYGSHPAFLKVNERPVIFIYTRVMGQVPLASWPAIVEGVRERAGTEPVLIADGYRDDFARILDGVHTYNVCEWVVGNAPDALREQARRRYAEAVALARSDGRIACLTVIPGYDDTKIRRPGINAERLEGATYRVLWEEATAAAPDWVLITSWNEWHEGSEIEASVEYGDAYLRATAEGTARFAASPAPDTASFARAGMDADRRRDLAALYDGARIGLLPGASSEMLLMLADTGLDAQELTAEELVETGGLTPERFPVLIYSAGERYKRTVNEDGDVDRALTDYLRAGGILVVMSQQPFPFFYDEGGTSVNGSQRLGLPLSMGWETPPPGRELRFEVDTSAVPSLPGRASFPESGDLRWRPVDRSQLAEGDIYMPLARLTDASEHSFGDGIAWIEHRESEPVGGRLLYCWMRVADAFPRGELHYALLRLVGERLGE